MKPKSKAKKIIAIITLVICASVLVFGTALAAGDKQERFEDRTVFEREAAEPLRRLKFASVHFISSLFFA